MFAPVNPRDSAVKREHETLAFWHDNKVFEKLVARNADGPVWSFLDGPITANNPMGVHHAWGRTYKDCFQRFQAMHGKNLRYQNGFDCQGLWVEVEVEKELGFGSKRDIESYGVDRFVRRCRERVLKYAAVQTRQSVRLGYWMDWDNSYYTMSDENNYAVWAFLKKCHAQGLIYKGADVMPWCPRCATGISQQEMHEGYRDVDDTAVFVRMPLTGRPGESLLVWTTTPWTLAANVACAVNPELTYAKVRQGDGVYYVAESRIDVMRSQGDVEMLERLRGAAMAGWSYRGPFDDLPAQSGLADRHRVVPWTDVSDAEGTGIVHIAPGCGREDFELGQSLDLPVLAPVDENGAYVDGYGFLTGRDARNVAGDVIGRLTAGGLLYRSETYRHSYPHCWRCDTPLLFRHVREWFIRMSWRDRIKENARAARWLPGWGLARELEWLDNMRDWMISKKRYWGLALPIYECECGWFDVVGSREELRGRALDGWEAFDGRSPHRPWIDSVTVRCGRCGKTASRIPDVGNPWLDAGIVPYSTVRHGGDRAYWKRWVPADLVVECFPGQFRNWFYALLAMSTMMEDVAPFKTLFGHALVKDENGEDMHKSKGNAIWFDDAVEKMGADVMRWYFCRQDPAANLDFGYDAGKELERTVFNMWRNVYAFFCNYARLDGFDPAKETVPVMQRPDMDRWILSDLHLFLGRIPASMADYDIAVVVRDAERFVDRLSNWYVRRNRRRFWRERKADDADKLAAYQTLHEVLVVLCRALAPVVPFMAEDMYRNLVCASDPSAPESVHLCRYPEADGSLVDRKLSADMAVAMDLTSAVLGLRQSRQLRVRQPLAEVRVACASADSTAAIRRFESHILDEVNVKRLTVAPGSLDDLPADRYAVAQTPAWTVALDTLLTEELAAEGAARDIVRHVQTLRKEKRLEMGDRIVLSYDTADESLHRALETWRGYIETETLATRVRKGIDGTADKVVTIEGAKLSLKIGKDG